MKNKIKVFVLLAITFMISCKKEILPPSTFIASQGTYMRVVHMAYEAVDHDDVHYEIYRQHPENAQWEKLTWTTNLFFNDPGWDYGNSLWLVPGKEYQYKMTLDFGNGSGEDSEIFSGYTFKPEQTEITSVTRFTEDGTIENTITWNDQNDYEVIMNIERLYYNIYRCANKDYSNFSKIETVEYYLGGNVQHDFSYIDDDYSLEADKQYSYKVIVEYTYYYDDDYYNRHGGSYSVEGTILEEEDNGNDPSTINYTETDLGQVLTSINGGILSIETKLIDNTIYVGAIIDFAAYGKPALYKLNGSSWQNVWNTIPEVEFVNNSFAINSSKSYMAGISNDSLCVYEWNGSAWSLNLTTKNLGAADSPSGVSIEIFNNELYMAIKQHPNDNLQVLKWDGTNTWDTIGGDVNGIIASGSIFDSKIKNIDGTLYIHYRIDDTFFIKHLNGTGWETDLEWTQEWLGEIYLNKHNSDLYFGARTRSWTGEYDGGVYKVSGTSTVENLISDNDEWFLLDAYAMTIDSNGDIIFSTTKYETDKLLYPALYLFNGTNWNTISGDFSNSTTPLSVETIGTDIYYIYGDASSENGASHPTILHSKKLSK